MEGFRTNPYQKATSRGISERNHEEKSEEVHGTISDTIHVNFCFGITEGFVKESL